MSKEIIVTKRTNDYHACLKDHPEMWGCGKSPKEAVGDLITSRGVTFDIEIAYDYPQRRCQYCRPMIGISNKTPVSGCWHEDTLKVGYRPGSISCATMFHNCPFNFTPIIVAKEY